MRYLLSVLITFTVLGCSDETRISVRVSPDVVIVENQQVHQQDFEKALRVVIEQKIQKGISRDQLIVDLKVHEATTRGEVADLEMSLRRLNVRKISYSTF